MFSTIPLLYMKEDLQRDDNFYREAVKINSMAMAWDLFNVSDEQILLEAIKHREGFRFFICRCRNDVEIANCFQIK